MITSNILKLFLDKNFNIYYRIQGAGLGGMKPNTVILGWPNSWRKKEEDSWRIFVDTIRNTAAAKMALLVPKGIQRCPDSGDKVKGKKYMPLRTQRARKFKKVEAKQLVKLHFCQF